MIKDARMNQISISWGTVLRLILLVYLIQQNALLLGAFNGHEFGEAYASMVDGSIVSGGMTHYSYFVQIHSIASLLLFILFVLQLLSEQKGFLYAAIVVNILIIVLLVYSLELKRSLATNESEYFALLRESWNYDIKNLFLVTVLVIWNVVTAIRSRNNSN